MKNINLLMRWFIGFLIITTVLAGCAGKSSSNKSQELTGNISVSGAWALYPMMTKWAEEFQKIYPNVQFDISAGGAGKGLADALAGAVDIGMVSRAITPEEEAKGAYWIAVTKDAVFPMVNAQNPYINDLISKGVTKQALIDIFITGKIKMWGEVIGRPEVKEEIHVYTRSDACGASEVWSKYLGDKKQEDLLGIAVYGDPGLLDAVVKDKLGIGYNNLGYAFDAQSGKPVAGSVALPIDVNENGLADSDELLETKTEAIEMVATNRYPSPPARALNLVTNGQPTGLIAEFVRWILTDGQKFVGEAGYVQLAQEQLKASLDKLP